MSLSPVIFLVIYAILVGIFLILSILNFYHIIRFGFFRTPSLVVTFIYLALVAAIIIVTFVALNHINWHQPIEINLPINSSTNEGLK